MSNALKVTCKCPKSMSSQKMAPLGTCTQEPVGGGALDVDHVADVAFTNSCLLPETHGIIWCWNIWNQLFPYVSPVTTHHHETEVKESHREAWAIGSSILATWASLSNGCSIVCCLTWCQEVLGWSTPAQSSHCNWSLRWRRYGCQSREVGPYLISTGAHIILLSY